MLEILFVPVYGDDDMLQNNETVNGKLIVEQMNTLKDSIQPKIYLTGDSL